MYSKKLKITFLGTGTSSGVPMIGCHCPVCSSEDPRDKRLRSSILITSENTNLVIDTGPDFRYQMLRTHNDKLDAVVFTHPHKDHTAGLDDIRAYNFFQKKAMNIYANQLTADSLKREFAYAFATENRYPGVPEFNLQLIDDSPFLVGDLQLNPVKVWHNKMQVFGYRIGNFTYITDANRIEEQEMDKIKGSEILIINALRKKEHISHFTLQQALDIAVKLNIPKTYLTHISHQLGTHKAVSQELPPTVSLAFDGFQFEAMA